MLAVKDGGCAAGTLVEVRSLFYNLPARRKFLRSDATELGHLQHTFLLYAIAQPHLAWTLQQETRTVHQLVSAGPQSGNAQKVLLSRIKALHGNQLASQLLPLELRREGIYLRGWIGKPGLSRSNRSELYCFVNSRPVDSRAIYYGLIEGYHTALMRGRYPVCFLFVDIDPASVDVNIHPAKREVRFREDARVQGVVVEAVRKALGLQGVSIQNAPLHMTLGTSFHRASRPPITSPVPAPANAPIPANETLAGFQNFSVPPKTERVTSQLISGNNPIISPRQVTQEAISNENQGLLVEGLDPDSSTVLGVFANLYVIAMDSTGLLIIDQHAAHERILFEQMMDRLSQGNVPSQRLLLPQTVELPPNDAVKLKSQLSLLEKMGFGIAEFGDRSFIVDALPPLIKIESINQLLRQIIDEMNEAGKGLNRDRFAEEKVAKTVCRHAIKANDVLRTEELKRMIKDLKECRHPLTCPHGRPTILRLTQAELEKKFGRRPIEG